MARKQAKDYDWDRIEHAQNPPPSGKDKNSRGGNDRVRNKTEYDKRFDKIMSTCKECGRERPFGQKCECGQ